MTTLPANRAEPTSSRPQSAFSEKPLANLRRAMGTVGTKTVLMQGFSITPADQLALRAKLSTFRRQLTAGPADRGMVGAELTKLVTAFPMQDAGGATALRVDAYREALGDSPSWAVREARLKFIRGEIGDGRFAPTPAQLVVAIDAILRPLRNDLFDLEALTTVEPVQEPTPEDRAAAAVRADVLVKSLQPEPKPFEKQYPIGEGPFVSALRAQVAASKKTDAD